ncbi:hypothetical protein HMPREF9372_0287 [Sporosarcina newyorkensis 2681]|uniref:Nucleotidase n=1 Tax=Sporosarcina newyorkensis 2681 TaxID=1027292 RepID=F9DNA7_9BACL|nr:hypothetical protein HMPREF9372_0287 [Sporosarcina newyorkensis 2681]
MKQLRFGIDIDGTVTCPTSLLPHINKRFGSNLTLDDVKEYDLTKAFDVDPVQFGNWYKEAEELIYQTSPAQQYAKEILTNWQKIMSCSIFLPAGKMCWNVRPLGSVSIKFLLIT